MDLPLLDHFAASPDRFLWHQPTRTAILADLHLGYESEMSRRGNFLPDFTQKPLTQAWAKILDRRPARIILAGDIFHSPQPDPAAIAAAQQLFHTAAQRCDLILLPGNHDPAPQALTQIFHDTGIKIAPETRAAGWLIRHGHHLADAASPDLIVGHQHPAVTLANRLQTAKMICFAVVQRPTRSPAQKSRPQNPLQRIILLPAFSPAPLGSNLLTSRNWLLDVPVPRPEEIRIAGIVKDQVLDFGPLADLPG